MTRLDEVGSSPMILGPEDGDILGGPDTVLDRFIIEEGDSGGRFALIEHRLAPKALAAPLHLHTKEDEYSFILEGEVGAYLGGTEVVAQKGIWSRNPEANGTPSGMQETRLRGS